MASAPATDRPIIPANIPSGRTLIVLLAITAAATAAVLAGVVIMAMASQPDPALLPEAGRDHRALTAHPEGFLELYLHAQRLGDREEASYPAQITARDKRYGNMERLLRDAATRRGWLLHQGTMLVLPVADLPELESAARDLTGWLAQDAAQGGEPSPPTRGTLLNVRLDVETTGPQVPEMLIGAVLLAVIGGFACLLLIMLSAVTSQSYLKNREQRNRAKRGPDLPAAE